MVDRARAKSGNGELHGVLRNAIGRTALQQFDGSTRTFLDIAVNDNGVNSNGAQPAIVRQWSPSVEVCPGQGTTFNRVYRARASRIATAGTMAGSAATYGSTRRSCSARCWSLTPPIHDVPRGGRAVRIAGVILILTCGAAVG